MIPFVIIEQVQYYKALKTMGVLAVRIGSFSQGNKLGRKEFTVSVVTLIFKEASLLSCFTSAVLD